MKPTKIVAVALGGIATVDLLTGRSVHPVLPNFLANVLTQETDIVLLAVAAFIWMYA